MQANTCKEGETCKQTRTRKAKTCKQIQKWRGEKQGRTGRGGEKQGRTNREGGKKVRRGAIGGSTSLHLEVVSDPPQVFGPSDLAAIGERVAGSLNQPEDPLVHHPVFLLLLRRLVA